MSRGFSWGGRGEWRQTTVVIKSANTRNRGQCRTQNPVLAFWSPKESGHAIESRSSLFILDNRK